VTRSLPPSESHPGDGPSATPEEPPADVNELGRVDRWIGESREIIGRVLPEIVEDRQRQNTRVDVAEDTYRRLRIEATTLRGELTDLHTEARALRHQMIAIGDSARGAVAQLTEAVRALEELQPGQPKSPAGAAPAPPARRRWRFGALAGWGATAALLLVGALLMQSKPLPLPPPPAAPAPAPSPAPPAAAPTPSDQGPALEPPARPKIARLPEKPSLLPRNEIRRVRVASVSGHELRVVVDYAYDGDHGTNDIFIHAAALEEGDELRHRVPGTSFPFAPIGVGDGSVTISIAKQSDTGPSVSTRVKVCMVSIKSRSAFACQIFPYFKAWDS
jgi:hypothetical protein